MANHIYTVEEIKSLVQPVAQHYGVERMALFGSYARGKATTDSDVDLRIDSGDIRGYFKLAGFQIALENVLDKSVDVLTTGALDDEFLERIKKEEVILYERGTQY